MKHLFEDFSNLSKEIFGVDLFTNVLTTASHGELLPVDIIQHESYLKFLFDTGVSQKSYVKIEFIEGNILTVSVKKDNKYTLDSKEVVVSKGLAEVFKQRKFKINPTVYNLTDVEAEFKDGILVVIINKKTKTEAKKSSIEIK